MDVNIVNCTFNYLDTIYQAGRGCYGLEKITDETIEMKQQFIRNLINDKHESVLEHCHISINIIGCSRSFMSQITRHRLVSFSIKSQHFVEHSDFNYKELEVVSERVKNTYYNLMEHIREHYNYFVDKCNVPIYIAREILPNSCLTNIFMTTNFREWRYIIKLRQTDKNVPEMIKFAKEIKRLFKIIIPEVFNDL